MSKRAPKITLKLQIFLVMVTVALISTLSAGLLVKYQITNALGTYWAGGMGAMRYQANPAGNSDFPAIEQGRGFKHGDKDGTSPQRGWRSKLGQAEHELISTVDRGILVGGVVAVFIAGIGSAVVSRRISRPLVHLDNAVSEAVSSGTVPQQIEVFGTAEVATLVESYNELSTSLQEAEFLRQRLVADVAHELRNPLASMRAQIEALEDGIIMPTPENLSSLGEDIAHLSGLVADLQELSLAEAGKLSIELEQVDIVSLVHQAFNSIEAQVSSDVELKLDTYDEHVWVMGDRRRILQVLLNLLSNAARHTDSGSITVSIVEQIEAHSSGFVEITVTDTGEGISEEDQRYIFERFYRTDKARSARQGGVGVGLTISLQLVEAMGGVMKVSSEFGKGTSIQFTLPAFN